MGDTLWNLNAFLSYREDRVSDEEVDERYDHFADRAKERFDLEVSRYVWDELCRKVFLDHHAFFRFQHSLGTSVYDLSVAGQSHTIYWSERSYCAQTILPKSDFRLQGMRNNALIHRWSALDELRKVRQRDALLLGVEYMNRIPRRPSYPEVKRPIRDPESRRFTFFPDPDAVEEELSTDIDAGNLPA